MVSDDGREVRVEEVLQEGVPWDWDEDKDQVVDSGPSCGVSQAA